MARFDVSHYNVTDNIAYTCVMTKIRTAVSSVTKLMKNGNSPSTLPYALVRP